MNEPKSWCTVVPLMNLDDGLKTPVYFAKGLWLTLVPDWIRQDMCAEILSSSDRETLKQLRYAFIVEYAAACSGAPDPDWDGPEPRSIQEAKHEVALLANLAFWIVRASPACFDLVFHAPRWQDGWNIQRGEKHGSIICHPLDRSARLTNQDLEQSIGIHAALCKLPSANSIWTALRSTWSALQIGNSAVRELVMWIALEALFGAEGGREEEGGLPRKIGYFLAADQQEAGELRIRAEKGYALRCRLAHGERIPPSDLATSSHETETLIRRSLAKILLDVETMNSFCGTGREPFLNALRM
jgi:hypothetical protein